MGRFTLFIIAGLLLFVCTAPRTAAVQIRIDYSFDDNNFFDTVQKRGAMELAAELMGRRLTDSLGPISTLDSSNRWTATFLDPAEGALLMSPTVVSLPDFNVATDELVVFVGGQNLMGESLARGGAGGINVSFTSNNYLNSVFARGQGDGTITSVRNPSAVQKTAVDFAPWGGAITFDTTATWSFDIGGPTLGRNDFLSVAVHELGHLLGIGQADSWRNKVSGSNGVFAGFFATQTCNCAPSLTGTAHLAFNTESFINGVEQEAAMDPNLTVGTRKLFTDLDFALLKDIGWTIPDVTVVPGDVDANGRVEILDYETLKFYFGRSNQPNLTPLTGNFDGNNAVNIYDALMLQANFGFVGDGSAAPPQALGAGAFEVFGVVPEPGTAAVAVVMAFIAGRRRARIR